MRRGTPMNWFVLLALLTGVVVASYQAAARVTTPGDDLQSTEMRGTIGIYRVGLNYTLQQRTQLVAAHYFYSSQLKNIPLQGAVKGEAVNFEGADGSKFRLRFVGNGSNGSQPLTFYNSVGLEGTWTLGKRSFPVDLRIQHSTENPGQRMYTQVTQESDEVYEARVAKLQMAVLSGNVAEAARYVHFPLRVNRRGRPMIVRDPTQLRVEWGRIFSPAFLVKLRTDMAHEMFVRNGEAMLGDGELWFDDKGLAVVNSLPDSSEAR